MKLKSLREKGGGGDVPPVVRKKYHCIQKDDGDGREYLEGLAGTTNPC